MGLHTPRIIPNGIHTVRLVRFESVRLVSRIIADWRHLLEHLIRVELWDVHIRAIAAGVVADDLLVVSLAAELQRRRPLAFDVSGIALATIFSLLPSAISVLSQSS